MKTWWVFTHLFLFFVYKVELIIQGNVHLFIYMIWNTSKSKDDQMSRKSLYILQDVKLVLRKFKRPQIGFIGGIIFFYLRKEGNLVQMYRFGHNVTWRDAHCKSSSEFIDLNLSMFVEDYRTFLRECQKWGVYPFGHNVELTGKYVSKPASNSTLELWQKGLKICGEQRAFGRFSRPHKLQETN